MSAPSIIDQISASLSISSLQHQVIASNLANRNTEGYERMKLRFERAMDSASVSATVMTDRSAAPVPVEQDLVALSSNAMRYETLARALYRYFSLISSITNPNRG